MDTARNKAKQSILLAYYQKPNRMHLSIEAGGMQSGWGSQRIIAVQLGRRIWREKIRKYRAEQKRQQERAAANQTEIDAEFRVSHDSIPGVRAPRARICCRQ